jgi:hypothetical protein
MKRYKYYLLLVFVFLVAAIFLFLKDKPGTLKIDRMAFSVTDTAAITAIKFSDGKNRLDIERIGSSWKVNQAFYAKPLAIKAMLYVLMNLEIKSPIPNSMEKQILQSFNNNVLTVSVESSGKELIAYRIAENNEIKIGSFMMLKDDNEPYVVKIPGYDGRISKLFPCDLQFWRDKTIFRYRPGDVLSVEVNYPDKPISSFVYQFVGAGRIQIKPLNNNNKPININKETARAFLINFASVSFMEQVKARSHAIFDSLSHQKPYCEIRVTNAATNVNILKTYWIPVHGKKEKFDLYRMYAVHQNDTVPVIVKYTDFDPIMKEYSDFLHK